jgi:hypothetical protein
MRLTLSLLLVVVLTACSGGGSSPPVASDATQSSSTATAATSIASAITPTSEQVSGRIDPAVPGTVVYLFAPDPAATTLVDQAATLRQVAFTDDAGRFRFAVLPAPHLEVVASAPGHALVRSVAESEARVRLEPEGRIEASLDVGGEPAEDAMAIVRDPRGRFLPLTATELATGPDGRLSIGKLPAGDYDVFVSAADGQRFDRRTVSVGEAEQVEIAFDLRIDNDLKLAFLAAVGGDEAEGLVEAVR